MESKETELKFLYLAFDLIVLNMAFFIICSISPFFSSLDIHERNLYLLHANMSEMIAYLIVSKRNLYIHDSFSKRIKNVIKRMELFVIVLFISAQIFLPAEYSNLFLIEYTIVFFAGKVIYYYVLFEYLRFRRTKGLYVHRVIIVSDNEMGMFLSNLLINNPMLGYDFVGYVSEKQSAKENVLGRLHDLSELVAKHQVDFIFVTDSHYYNARKECKKIVMLCNKIGVRLRIVPENQQWFRSNQGLESVGSLVVINPQEIPLDGLKARFLKRSFDLFFSFMVILLLVSWLFPILFVLIKLSSKGPIFFLQERTGINNRTFKCLKFRSMCVNGEANIRQATSNDERITPLGAFLRKSNIDELPQFFNVLLGNMSVVGPRPHMLKHTEQYSQLIEDYKVRHYVKPGITGWAQVNGYRGLTDELWKMQKRVEYDMYYLNHWSFWWDVQIIFMTIFGRRSHQNAG